MKYLLLISILLLSGCTQYQYDVTYEKCNGQTGSTIAIGDSIQLISRNRELVVTEEGFPRQWNLVLYNVCDFYYTRLEILTK